MTPEERFTEQVWEILQSIKEESFATKGGEPVKHHIPQIQGAGIIPKERRINILFKLQEWGALRVRDDPFEPPISADDEIYVDLIQPKFDHIYGLYQNGGSFQENVEEKPSVNPTHPPIIKLKTLELIAREIGEMDSASNLIRLLTDCGVSEKLIEYPQTKWRMIYAVFVTLATSDDPKNLRVLYKIIEEACHPVTHQGNEDRAKEVTSRFNSLLKYDGINLENGKLFIKSSGPNGDEWVSSDNEVIEPECYLILPKDVAKLYVFWNELIKLAKFYLSNPSNQDDELNEIYFELIELVENTLANKSCGSLHLQYKRPFSNLIGCEYEVVGADKKTEDILKTLFTFFGEITATSLPEKKYVEEARKEIINLLDKIGAYIKTHTPKVEVPQEKSADPQPIDIRIVSGKMEVEGLEKGLNAIAKTGNQNTNRFPYKLPAGTKWENFTIKFNDNENVFIKVKQLQHTADFKEMGFIGRGANPNPSEAWAFLKVLAKRGGELTVKDTEARDKYKKQKELLAKSLQDYFSLDYDPFYPYRSSLEKNGDSYKIKITLIPPSDENRPTDPGEADDSLGIEEYMKETSPQVYEENH